MFEDAGCIVILLKW